MRRAFTLVELLVIVAIVALVVGLLLTTLSPARQEARTTKCQANLASLGKATQVYVASHDRLPVASEYPDSNEREAWDVDWRVWQCPSVEVHDGRDYSYLAGAFLQDNLLIITPDPRLEPEVRRLYEDFPALPLFEDGEFKRHAGARNAVRYDGSVVRRR